MNKHIVSTAVCLAAAGLLVSGCGGDGDGGGTAAKSPSTAQGGSGGKDGGTGGKPAAATAVITVAEANKLLDRYTTVNNDANTNLDAEKLATIEGGALLQVDQQAYKQYSGLSDEVKSGFDAFTYTQRKFYIPATGDWFMASAYTGHIHQLIVFRKGATGWRMVAANVYDGTLPAVATDAHGAVTVVDAGATVGGTSLPGLGAAVTDLRATGGTKAGTRLADSAARQKAVKMYTNRNAHWEDKSCATTRYEATNGKGDSAYAKFPDTYAVKTADGGALVAATSYYAQQEVATHPSRCRIYPDDVTAVYLRGDQSSVRMRYASLNVVSVPAAGKPVLMGEAIFMVGATA